MSRIVIASASAPLLERLSRLLASSGRAPCRACSSEGELRRALSCFDDGIVILAGPLPGLSVEELALDHGEKLQILVLAKPGSLEECTARDVFSLALPVSAQALTGAVEMLEQLHRMRLPRRDEASRELTERAKAHLMATRGFTEPQAHRYLQQYAMEHRMKMADCANDILTRQEGST